MKHILETGKPDNVARVRFLHFDSLHSLEMKNRGDFALENFSVAVSANRRVAELHFSLVNFSECDTAQIIAVIQVRHEPVENRRPPSRARRDVLRNRLEQRLPSCR